MGKKESSKSKWMWLFAVPLAVTLLAVAANYLFPQWFGQRDGLAVAPSWPAMEGCDFTAVAGAPGSDEPVLSAAQTADRAAVASEEGGGAWGSGNLTLLVTPSGDRQIVVSSITPEVKPVDEDPEWIVMQLAQCGGLSYREFELDLDAATLTDNGVLGEPIEGESIPQASGTDAFVVDAEQAASVVIAAFACQGSYDFWLDIAYVVSGSSSTDHKKLGPYRVYGGDAILADPEVESFGNPEAGQPSLPSKCKATAPSSPPSTPSPTPLEERATPQSAQAALIPAGTCGDGSTYGWDQRYPIQLVNGSGEQFDASGVGAGILDSHFVGAEDVNGDDVKDAVLVINCTGSTADQCCAGRTSTLNFVVALDMSGATPTRLGEAIQATHVDIADGEGFREIEGDTVTLDGNEILAHASLTYPEELAPDVVAANEGWYRFTFANGQWSSTAE